MSVSGLYQTELNVDLPEPEVNLKNVEILFLFPDPADTPTDDE